MTEPILSVRHLQKRYPNGVEALKDLTFDVAPGEFLAILGSSGCGKSTLLRCLNRLLEPSAGDIVLGAGGIKSTADIAMIFQGFNLIPRYSVLKNVLMGRLGSTSTLQSIFGIFSDEDQKQAMAHLQLVGIAPKAYIRADQLSGGQQQRVSIARALTQKPKILLADEPVASLDPESRQTVMNYLRKVNRELGITVICSLHSVELAREYATRVIALKAGEIVFNGSAKELTEAALTRIYT